MSWVTRQTTMSVLVCLASCVALSWLCATKPLSLRLDDFVFTWPVSLFVAFQATVYQVRFRRHESLPPGRPWRGRLVAVGFVLVCFSYYSICRQLSLVTEWIFLCGFPGACVFCLMGPWYSRKARNARLVIEVVLTAIAFTAFFWSAVALLSLKFEILDS